MVKSTSSTDLVADCARCCGLCCIAPAFAASEDFAYDKPAYVACRHLGADNSCAIYGHREEHGFRGCTGYDCAGAGQKVMQSTFQGRSWHELTDPTPMFEAFMVMRALHELLVVLNAAQRLDLPGPMAAGLATTRDAIEAMTYLDPGALADLELETVKRHCADLLREVGALREKDSRR